MRRIINRLKRLFNDMKNRLVYLFLMFAPNRSICAKKSERSVPVLVSLTSYPARFKTVYLSIKSVMYQTVRPDRVVLYLDEDVDIDAIPDSLSKLKKYGLEIVKRPYNIKCHKKYYHAISENPDCVVITVDDDSMYHRKTIELLYNAHLKNPTAVCAKRVHKIKCDKEGVILPYNDWDLLCTDVEYPSDLLMATGVGGVLYPPHCLYKDTFDVERITKYSLKADDVWLKYMEYLQGTKVLWVPNKHMEPYQIPDTQTSGLFLGNVDNQGNDEYISVLNREYNIDWSKVTE